MPAITSREGCLVDEMLPSESIGCYSPLAQPAADRRRGLPLTIIGIQPAAHRHRVRPVLDRAPLEIAGHCPTSATLLASHRLSPASAGKAQCPREVG
jgi:hypothetical protein